MPDPKDSRCRGTTHAAWPAGVKDPTCQVCGGGRCTARAKTRPGERCRRSPVEGSTVCHAHGAAQGTSARAAADLRVQEQQQQAAVVTYGLPREVPARQALLEELYRTAGHVAWLEATVRDLDPGALTWGITKAVDKQATQFGGRDTTSQAVVSVWLGLYHRERKHLIEVSATIEKLKLDEREVALKEQQAVELVGFLRRMLVRLGLNPLAPEVHQVVQDELRTLAIASAA